MIGSTDSTKEIIHTFIEETKENEYIEIKYFYQENNGKMTALNNLINNTSDSDLLIECDSDDYFSKNAFKIIIEKYNLIKDKKNMYALCFLKNDENLCNIGNLFKSDNYESNMFDLYFRELFISLIIHTHKYQKYI